MEILPQSMTKGKYIGVLACLMLPLCARGQEIAVKTSEHFFLDTPYITDLVTGRHSFEAFDVSIGWRTDGSEAAEMFGHPRLGIGFSYADFGRVECVPGSRMGDSYSLYGFFMRDFLHGRVFSAGYSMELGGALMTHYYHKTDNPHNRLYSGPFAFHVKGGLYVRAQLTPRWAVTLEGDYRHNSSARLFIPNAGINSMGFALSARYAMSEKYLSPGGGRTSWPGHPLDSRWRFALYGGGGIHRCLAEYNADKALAVSDRHDPYNPWFKGNIGLEAVWRYSRKTSTGVQLELQYLSNTEILRVCDEILYDSKDNIYSPLSPGVCIIQDVYFGPMTAGIGVGAYIYRQVGEHEYHGPVYQKVNLRYYLPFLRSVFVGASLRAHYFSQVDYLEFNIGKVI